MHIINIILGLAILGVLITVAMMAAQLVLTVFFAIIALPIAGVSALVQKLRK